MTEEPLPPTEHYSESRAYAERRVKNPALWMMITAIAGSVLNVIYTLASLMELLGDFGEMPGMEPALMHAFSIGSLVVGLAIAVVVYMAASRMQRLESWGFALAGAILAGLPFCSPCCCIGLPVGIWAVVVLLDEKVKGQFR
jgi:hypothetical protein